MTDEKLFFLDKAAAAAEQAKHLFPKIAACEAALESAWGKSGLAIQDNNLFGMKQHRHPVYGTQALPTKEFENGEWIQTSALWIHYPGWSTCFFDRMFTLLRLASVYPHYEAAVNARDPETFVREVSQTWSTDPARAEKVLAIYRPYIALRDVVQKPSVT